MKNITLILFCILVSSHCFSQKGAPFSCGLCTDSVNLRQKVQDLDEKRLYCFIHFLSANACQSSAEYMEFANPFLFQIAQTRSADLISLLQKYPELDNKTLHSELSHPLLDYDVKRLIFVVDSTNPNSTVKGKILHDLQSIRLDKNGYPQ